eukprot:GGOE01007739.1.p1 GENE.GGOE01007739.1~~GGOE01007739.1.p1  ORF type:complete len:430 (+),score=70.26 GGOE01007739.1:20-1309(+)
MYSPAARYSGVSTVEYVSGEPAWTYWERPAPLPSTCPNPAPLCCRDTRYTYTSPLPARTASSRLHIPSTQGSSACSYYFPSGTSRVSYASAPFSLPSPSWRPTAAPTVSTRVVSPRIPQRFPNPRPHPSFPDPRRVPYPATHSSALAASIGKFHLSGTSQDGGFMSIGRLTGPDPLAEAYEEAEAIARELGLPADDWKARVRRHDAQLWEGSQEEQYEQIYPKLDSQPTTSQLHPTPAANSHRQPSPTHAKPQSSNVVGTTSPTNSSRRRTPPSPSPKSSSATRTPKVRPQPIDTAASGALTPTSDRPAAAAAAVAPAASKVTTAKAVASAKKSTSPKIAASKTAAAKTAVTASTVPAAAAAAAASEVAEAEAEAKVKEEVVEKTVEERAGTLVESVEGQHDTKEKSLVVSVAGASQPADEATVEAVRD